MHECGAVATMSCSSTGDPHVSMFSPGKSADPQGIGPYILAQNADRSFVVQACHKLVSVGNGVSRNTALAVRMGAHKELQGAV